MTYPVMGLKWSSRSSIESRDKEIRDEYAQMQSPHLDDGIRLFYDDCITFKGKF